MHVFCDESGGTGRDDSLFLVAAVPLAAADASRLMRKFRKATGSSGEVKGSRLPDRDRRLFLELFGTCPAPLASVVYCRGLDPLGNWALNALPDHDLWAELVVESTLALEPGGTVAVSADRRYGGARRRSVHDRIAAGLAARTGANRVQVQSVDSQGSDGVQVADIIANTAYRLLSSRGLRDDGLSPEHTRKIVLRPVALAACRPRWLAPLPA